MSLINQVLKDLDARQPMHEKPANVSLTAPAPEESGFTDWLRLMVWVITLFLVIAYLVYIWVFEPEVPEIVAVQPVSVSVVPSSGPLKTGSALSKNASADDTETGMQVSKPVDQAEEKLPAEKAPAQAEAKIQQQDSAVSLKKDDVAGVNVSTGKTPVAYLPLHDDGKPVETGIHKKSEIVVVKTKQSPLAIARSLLNEGRLTEAERQLQQILKKSPSDIAARELLIGMLLRDKRLSEADSQIEQGLKFYPGRENLVLMQAKMLLDENNIQAAVAVLQKHAQSVKNTIKSRAMLASVFQQQANYTEAAKLYAELVQAAPAESSYWLGLAINLEALGQSEKAVAAYQRAVQSGGLSISLQQYAMQRIAHYKRQDVAHE